MVPDYIDATVIYEDGLNFIVGKICRVLVRRLAQLHIQVGELTSTGGCAGTRIGASAERAAWISAHNDVMRIDVITSISGSILVPLIEVEVPTTQRTMWRCSKHCVRYLITPEPHLALVSQRLRHIGTCDGMIYLACSSMLTS